MNLLNRVAFITGGSQGLGKAFTEALLKNGAKVCFIDLQDEKGKQVESEFKEKYGPEKAFFLKCDVASSGNLSDCFQKAVTKFGNIDIMVNNAGVCDESKWKDMININLVGAIEGSMLAIEHMRKDKGGKGGKIINVASTAGLIGAFFLPTYSASKFGLVGFHRGWAGNPYNSQLGLQFGCLCPAFTDTAMVHLQPHNLLYYDDGMKFVNHFGINKVETVVEAFLKLVQAENCNGDILTITNQNGIEYYKKKTQKSNL